MAEPVQIVIDSRIRVNVTALDAAIIAELKGECEHRNSAFFKLAHLGLPTYTEPRVIKTWKAETKWEEAWLTFPRGALKRIIAILDNFGLDRHYDDKRSLGVSGPTGIPKHKVVARPYQQRLIDASLDLEQGILKAPTAAGKTTAAFGFASLVGVNTLIIVPNANLYDQWIERAHVEFGLNKKEIGVIRGKKRVLKPLTIAMQKTLAMKVDDPELLAYFGAIVCDEAQLFAAKTFMAAVDPFPAKWRIAVSADHRRKDKKEFLIHDLFGGVIAEITRRELIEAGWILDTEVRVVPSEFRADWYGVPEADEAGNDKGFVTFDPSEPASENDEPPPESGEQEKKTLDFDRLLSEMANDDARNDLIVDWTARMHEELDEQVLVMNHRREHCRLLDMFIVRRGLATGFLIGGPDYKHEFDQTRAAFMKGDLSVAIGTFQAIGYGIDLPKAAVVVCSTPIAGNKLFLNQVRGRVCRAPKGKRGSWMLYVWDRHVYGLRHLKNLMHFASKVVVWDHERWVDAKTYLRAARESA